MERENASHTLLQSEEGLVPNLIPIDTEHDLVPNLIPIVTESPSTTNQQDERIQADENLVFDNVPFIVKRREEIKKEEKREQEEARWLQLTWKQKTMEFIKDMGFRLCYVLTSFDWRFAVAGLLLVLQQFLVLSSRPGNRINVFWFILLIPSFAICVFSLNSHVIASNLEEDDTDRKQGLPALPLRQRAKYMCHVRFYRILRIVCLGLLTLLGTLQHTTNCWHPDLPWYHSYGLVLYYDMEYWIFLIILHIFACTLFHFQGHNVVVGPWEQAIWNRIHNRMHPKQD